MPDNATPATDTTKTATTTENATGTLLETTATTTVKPGHKTTEFAMSLLAIILGACYATDLIPTGTVYAKVAAIAAITLTALGYTVVRGKVKSGAVALMLFGFALGSSQIGCATLKTKGDAGGRKLLDCAASSARDLVGELAPTFGNAVRNALDSSGKIDRNLIGEIAAPLKTAATRCALDAAITAILTPGHARDGSPLSSPLEVDAVDVTAAYADVRANLWGVDEVRR